MRQQILVSLTTGHCAEEIDVTETCCESKIQAAADRLGVPREWQVQRSIAEIWAMHRQRSSEALNVFMCARINRSTSKVTRAEPCRIAAIRPMRMKSTFALTSGGMICPRSTAIAIPSQLFAGAPQLFNHLQRA